MNASSLSELCAACVGVRRCLYRQDNCHLGWRNRSTPAMISRFGFKATAMAIIAAPLVGRWLAPIEVGQDMEPRRSMEKVAKPMDETAHGPLVDSKQSSRRSGAAVRMIGGFSARIVE